MEVTGILTSGLLEDLKSKQWQPGDRLLVEVVQKNGENQGTIQVKGDVLSAVLETSTQVGDKFWVQVGEIEEGYLLLIRETQAEKAQDIPAPSLQFAELKERGLPPNQELLTLVREFPLIGSEASLEEALQGSLSDEFLAALRKSFPQWESLSGENGAQKIIECLRKLGLNYEQRILQMSKLNSQAKELEKESLRNTLKFSLLDAVQKQKEEYLSNSPGVLARLLDKITGQQLWLKTGTLNNGYVLVDLPLMNQEEFMPLRVGLESARKGSKMDEKHCRVAIQLETKGLGVIGIDAFFDQDAVTMNILTADTSTLSELVENVLPETKVQFARLGFKVLKVTIENLDQNIEFQNFLQGLRRSGVDVAG
ncbi:hypothetical protein REC12_10135 [Desulfosporosinus sp. PR]|uniref:hypothetical protein n=1 Tax=Candidatus Desulfosporosinus nitrosoreducens TaxID=3401928 RepID=UPI0027F25C09|nr:hypothetical protein [Desulfosporosinus sp. PR]MDQ7093948.1 hypothetical protein [Desulfosporosinus sp. PR]